MEKQEIRPTVIIPKKGDILVYDFNQEVLIVKNTYTDHIFNLKMIEYYCVSEIALETKEIIGISHLTIFYRFASEEDIKRVKDKIAEMLKSITIGEKYARNIMGFPAR